MSQELSRRPADLDPEEVEFMKACASELGEIHARTSGCPRPEMLLAMREGTLPQEVGARVAPHLESCPWCQMLARDLEDLESVRPTPEEEVRIRAYVLQRADGLPKRISIWSRLWQPVPVAAFAGLILVAGLWVGVGRRAPIQEKPPVPLAIRVPPAAPTVLRLEKPPVKLPAAGLLVWRGEAASDEKRFLTELGRALDPYRADDFAEAERRLDQLARRYPRQAEPHFYLGICRLFLNQAEKAVSPLENAKRSPEGPLAQDAAWYLSLAYFQAGKKQQAAAGLEKICQREGEHRTRACAALQELRSQEDRK